MPRLKVFQAHLGFFDTVVAAPSQKAALEAWGSRQNLFHNGTASVASDHDAIKAALAKPGIVLKRLSGSQDPFAEQPALPKVSGKGRHRVVEKSHGARQPAQKAAPKPHLEPDRSKLDAAERALAGLKAERERIEAEFKLREQELRQQREARARDFAQRRATLEQNIENEKKVLRHSRKR